MNHPSTPVIRYFALTVFMAVGLPSFAKHPPHSKPEVTVAILMFDGVQIIDFAGPYEVFGQAGFGVFTVSEGGKTVETAMGLSTVPDYAIKSAPEFDVLLVPGGNVHDASENKAIRKLIQRHAGTQQKIMSVCTGSFILAKSGILDGLKATTFHRSLDGFEEDYPRIDVVKGVRWTDNGQVITSAGLSSGIDAALHLVAQFRSEEIARSTALHLEYDWQPENGFVRTNLADQYLPDLDVKWPRSTDLDNVFSIGDEHYWQRRIRITSPRPLDELMGRIDAAMNMLTHWKVLDSGTRAWTTTDHAMEISVQLVHVGSTGTQHELDVLLNVQ